MTPSLHLCRATNADVEELAEVHVQAWREAYAGLIPQSVLDQLDAGERAAMWRAALDSGSIVFLAKLSDRIVGFGACRRQPDASLSQSAEISALYVLERAQRHGIGRALMTAMARELLAQGHQSASLWVLEANANARRFYVTLSGHEITRRAQERGGFRSIGIAYGWNDLATLL
jgi:ribosomal protein S18 acetylase RimI-like enzyme